MSTPPSPARSAWWQPLWEFVTHVIVGSALFIIILAPAVGLDLLVSHMKANWQVGEFLVTLLTGAKYVVATLDVVLYLIFMLTLGYRFVRTLWGYDHDVP